MAVTVPDPATTEWVPLSGSGPQGPKGDTGADSTVQGPIGPEGPAGPQGDPGPQGTPGLDGERWFSGTGAPAGNLAGSLPGDWYVRSDTGDVYEKTGTNVWTLQLNLKGPQGSQGIQGIQGVKGDTGAPGGGMTLIQLLTPSSSAITFTAIPQTYTHLRLVLLLRTWVASTIGEAYIRFNADATSPNYQYRYISTGNTSGSPMNYYFGTGSQGMLGSCTGFNSRALRYTPIEVLIPYYTTTAHEKTWSAKVGESRDAMNYTYVDCAGAWISNAAITQIDILPNSGTQWASGSRAYLYGSI